MICLLVVTDGRRDCIEQTIPAALDHLHGPFTSKVILDDSGDGAYREYLAFRWKPHGFTISHTDACRGMHTGFGRTIGKAWDMLSTFHGPYVFHLEDDFVIERDVDLTAMVGVLESRPHLAQLALRRQPWNDLERAAGGIVEQHPADYVDCHDGVHDWLEHRRCFTTNPSLYRRSLCALGWPDMPNSEGVFTHQLLEDPATRFGFWGARSDGPWVTHVGHERAGVGY